MSRDPIGEEGHIRVRWFARNVGGEFRSIDIRMRANAEPNYMTFTGNSPVVKVDVLGEDGSGNSVPPCAGCQLPPPPPPTTSDCVCAAGTKVGRRQNPNYTIVTNGCTGVGPGPYNFTPACNQHDVCYSTCNSKRANCDMSFYGDMIAICQQFCGNDYNCQYTCAQVALLYYYGVQLLGGSHFDGDGAACSDCCCP